MGTSKWRLKPSSPEKSLGSAIDSQQAWEVLDSDGGPSTQAGSAGGPSGWMPLTLRAPVLAPFIALSLAIAAAIELLAQKSGKQGGLSLSPSADDVPALVTFSYLYLPTILAVLYSLSWTWIDLDLRRIQPWLDLSRSDGALAETSLLADYPFEFLAFVPVTAWKRRHWPVFFGGTAMMVIFWGITPLQSAILGPRPVVITRNVSMSAVSSLMSLDKQAYMMDASILNDAYGITWLKQPFPAFTSAAYALTPFHPLNNDTASLAGGTWTGPSTKLTTDLECWPANVNHTTYSTYYIDNGRGCMVQIGLVASSFVNGSATILYVGYYEDAHLDYYLESPDCDRRASNQFLAIWADVDRTTLAATEMTALFCETSYQKQNVSATISADSKHPLDDGATPLGEMEPLTDAEFNSTAFEFLIGVGVPPNSSTRDFANSQVLEQYPTLFDMGVTFPITNMVGFALGRMNNSVAELKNASVLGSVFAAAHRELFSAAISKLVAGDTRAETSPGRIETTLHGIVVSRPISAIVEGLLVLVAGLAGCILFIGGRAVSSLNGDPASLGDLITILKSSGPVLRDFWNQDCLSEKGLRKTLLTRKYKLLKSANSAAGEKVTLAAISRDTVHSPRKTGLYISYRPKELLPSTGVLILALLLLASGALAYLKHQESRLNGLPRPSDNFEVLQLIENYIPTIFSTLLEPLLILLNRLLCILQPFQDLRRGHARRSRTIDTRYTSIPPQLAFWRAFKSRHFLLGMVCIISLLANVLAVGLGGLFNEFPTTSTSPLLLKQPREVSTTRDTIVPVNAPTTFRDHFYVALTNLSTGTSLPPWLDSRFAYLPLNDVPLSAANTTLVYSAVTRGFGVETTCRPLSSFPDSEAFADYTIAANGSDKLTVTYKHNNGSSTTCEPSTAITGSPPIGIAAHEIFVPLVPASPDGNPYSRPDDGNFCEQKLALAWQRATSKDVHGSLKSTFIECESTLRTAKFQLEFDPAGYIVNSTRIGGLEDAAAYLGPNRTKSFLVEANNVIGYAGRPLDYGYGWHNDSFTIDWFNFLVKYYLNTTDLVDPAKPIPAAESMIPIAEDVYQRLFSILLGLNLSVFNSTGETVSVDATVATVDTRIFLDDGAFIVSMTILGLDIVVLAILYVNVRHSFLPRLPSSIASQIAFVAPSRAVKEYESGGTQSKTSSTYSFGHFIGADGRAHIGIESDPYVVPLRVSTLKAAEGPSGWSRSFLPWRRPPASTGDLL